MGKYNMKKWSWDIKEEIIKNYFLYYDKTNELEGFQDEIFTGWEKLNDIGFLENDFTNNDLEDMNDDIEVGTNSDWKEGSSDKDIEDYDK